MGILVSEKLQNCLIQYKGGGYDGCFWEYNYCFFNEYSEFIDLYSSGYKAIKDKEQLMEYIESDYNNYTIYNFKNNEVGLKEFSKELVNRLPYSNISPIFKTLYSKTDLIIDQYCLICENFDDPDNFISGYELGEYKGNGGIGIDETIEPICYECYRNNACCKCDTWFNPNNGSSGILYNELLNIDGCNNCLEDKDISLVEFFYDYNFDLDNIQDYINKENSNQVSLFPEIKTEINLKDYDFYIFNDDDSLEDFNSYLDDDKELDYNDDNLIFKIKEYLINSGNKDVIILDGIIYIKGYEFIGVKI